MQDIIYRAEEDDYGFLDELGEFVGPYSDEASAASALTRYMHFLSIAFHSSYSMNAAVVLMLRTPELAGRFTLRQIEQLIIDLVEQYSADSEIFLSSEIVGTVTARLFGQPFVLPIVTTHAITVFELRSWYLKNYMMYIQDSDTVLVLDIILAAMNWTLSGMIGRPEYLVRL